MGAAEGQYWGEGGEAVGALGQEMQRWRALGGQYWGSGGTGGAGGWCWGGPQCPPPHFPPVPQGGRAEVGDRGEMQQHGGTTLQRGARPPGGWVPPQQGHPNPPPRGSCSPLLGEWMLGQLEGSVEPEGLGWGGRLPYLGRWGGMGKSVGQGGLPGQGEQTARALGPACHWKEGSLVWEAVGRPAGAETGEGKSTRDPFAAMLRAVAAERDAGVFVGRAAPNRDTAEQASRPLMLMLSSVSLLCIISS